MPGDDPVRVSIEDLSALAAATAAVVVLARLEGHGEVVVTVGEDPRPVRIDLSDRPSFTEVSRRIERALPAEDRLQAALVQAGVELRPTGSGVEFVFDRKRFTRERILDLGDQLRIVIAALRATPDEPFDRCALLTPRARAVLPDPTATLDAPVQEPIERALARLASSSKAAAAMDWRGAVWSFGDLDARATVLAAALRQRGIVQGDRVIVTGQRCPAVVAAILAVWKCGAVIVPISESLPEQRREVMAREAKAVLALVVGSEGNDPSLATLRISEIDASIVRASGTRTAGSVPSAGPDAAYVFFTSGTTGTPKGIVGTHQGLAHFLTWQRRRFEVGPGDRAAQLTGLSFDVVMRDMFTPLSAGATLCFPEREPASMDPDLLLAWLRDQRITLMHSVPSVLESWLTPWRGAPSVGALRLLFMAGEPLTDVLVRRIRESFSHARIVNLYGPTETTLAKCFHEVSANPEPGIQPVGHAIPGAQAFVLNPAGTRCGVGETGEIVIRTPFRTLGYLGGETRGGKFRPNPFRDDEADLVYFTGDRGRHRQGGDLEILGRVDDQVKIHGVRVEPAEVSAALRTHADVLSCFVGAITEPGRPTSLCAWVVLDASARRDSDALRRYLADRLVAAMVPGSFVFLEKLPLSPNGKVDRKALPPPAANDARPHIAPRTSTEETLAEIWRAVLGLERIGIDESFFELGGHSLSATQVAAQVRRRLHVELPMRALFDHPTIAQLAERIAELAPTAAEPTLGRVRRDAPLPLSSSEARLWFLDQLEPGRATYNLHRVVRLRGPIDEGALARALTDLVARHETLRTRYEARAGEPTRLVDPAPDHFSLDRITVTDASDASPAIAREARRPFDLAKGPLFRAALFAIGGDEHVVALSMHHIVSDGWSLEIIERELAHLYAAHRDGQASALADLPIQYADYAASQREWMATDAMRRQLDYWKERLHGATDTLDLPTDRARPARRREQGGTVRIRLPDEVAAKVTDLARREECAPFMVLFAIFNVLLHRLTRQDDLVVGVPIANRARPELGASWGEGVVGFLVNTLAMRTRLTPKASFREVLATVKQSALDAYEHQDVPFELLVDALRIARDPSRTPLFQVMFAHETEPLLPSKAWGTNASIELPDLGIAKFDLRLQTEQLTDGLGVSLEYDSDLFDAETAVRLVSRYATLLDSALRAPDERIGSLVLLTEDERRQVVVDFNATRTELPTRRAVHELFEEQVARAPDAVAVELGDASLTYRVLDERANELAQVLLERGARGRVVAVVMERSLEMVIALYATLKAGAAYAPLDPSHPSERLAFMVDDLDAPVILSAGGSASAFADSARLVRVDARRSDERRARRERIPVRDEDLAYLIYTSGSTGKPKGVMNTHEGLRNRLLWMQAAYGLGAGDAVLQKTPYTFDVSVWEFFWPLLFGARLVVARPEGHRDPQYLAGVILAARITTIHFVPSMLEAFLESADVAHCKTLKRVVCSGEALPAKLVDRFHERLPWCELHNLYGPTEASIDVTFWQCRPGDRRDDIPIGAPISNTQMYVVDSEGAPSPIGVPGELCIAGIGLARGYWRRADLTADRFVPNPFATEPGARMYRTGDLARWSRDGNLQYLGRLDHQVKLRGLRIELGEIEHVLLAQPGIRAAVVLAREDRPGDKRLVAYVTAAADERPLPEELRRALARALPEYMVPSAIVLMGALPLSPNGKVDRKALPAPEAPARANDDEPPRGAREETIARTFAEILGVPRIGRNEDFFDLGGHSLLATRLVAHLRERLQVELPLRAIFEARTVAALAEHLVAAPRSAAARIEASSEEARVELSFAEARLWFLDQYESGTSLYNVTRMLRLRGALDETALTSALRDVVDRHESLRTRFTSKGGNPRRVVDPRGSPPLVEGRSAETEPTFRALLHEELHRGFDLERGPLFRATLVRRSAGEHVLLLAMHHVVTDGWSMDVLVRELSSAYDARRNAQEPVFEPLAIQYADYAAWQRAWLASGTLERQLAYWKEQLRDAPASIDLPTDRPRPLVKSQRGATLRFDLASDVASGVRALAQAEGATPFMVLLAAFDVLLARHAGIDDVVVGTPVAGRGRPEIESVVGFFVNTLVIRTRLDGRPSFREIVRRAKRATLDAFDHQDIPFERLVEELNPPRDTSRTPVIQVVFAFETSGLHGVIGRDLELATIPLETTTSKFDLTLTITERGGALAGALEYDAELFDPATAHAIAERYGVLLEAAVGAPDRRAEDLPITSAAERQRLLATWNATAREYPRDASIDALFAARAARSPDAVALAFGDRTMSYRELDEASNRIAAGLFATGVRAGARVGISSERSFDQIAGLLGILKAGAAYVPLDPSYPEDRLALLTREARVETALDPDGRLGLPASVRVLRNADLLARSPAERPRGGAAHGARHAAYVLFTSGSTGTPKGVVVEHRSVVRLTKNVTWAKLGEDDVFVALAPLAFDASTLEIWAPLVNGARLVVPPSGVLGLDEIASLLRAHSVTFAWMTAGLFHQMVDHAIDGLRGVRQLFAGGDVLSPSHVRKVLAELPGVRLVNGYGPTENTTFTTTHAVSELAVGRAVPIGQPITNTTVYVLDPHGEPAPIGVFGELYTGGDGVARGYLGARETASRFVPDPFGGPGARMYRTGDIARWRNDGVLEFAGRRDGQVKLRGFRIEVGEIEAALAAQPGVKQAAVVLREDRPGDKRLAAYVVGDATAALNVETLRAAAGRALPDYMVPSAFVVMDALPLNVNGKIDRKALPAPDFATEEQYVAPRTPPEETIAAAFAEALGAPRVGVHDDFFRLGGHSLLATRLAARLRTALKVEVPVRAIFECSTVAKLAERLGGARPIGEASTIPRVARGGPLAASYAQERLWFLEQLDPGQATYNVPLILRLRGPLDESALERTVAWLVARHESLRTTFAELEGRPSQVIHESMAVPLERNVDLAEIAARPFDLTEGPLLRAGLARIGEGEHVFALVLHHVVTDGASMGVLERELGLAYRALSRGESPALAPLSIQYADYAAWQREWLASGVLEQQLAYWKEALRGAPAALELPTDLARPATKQHRGSYVESTIRPEAAARIATIAREEGATAFMVGLAAYYVFLARHTGESDLVVGTPIAGRTRPELDGLVGFFVNTLALRVRLDGAPTFREVLRRVKKTALDAYERQDVPFEKIVEELNPARDPSRTPLFQTMFVFQGKEAAPVALPGVGVEHVDPVGLDVAKFDLTVTMAEDPEHLRLHLEYDVALFARASVERFAEHFVTLLDGAARLPDERIANLPLMTEAETRQVVAAWNATELEVGSLRTVHGLFEAQARRTPDAVAVECDGRALSYRELDGHANRVAQWLLERGVHPGACVAVEVRRSHEMLAALLGTMKAGAAYVPIDGALPDDRKAFMKEDAGAKITLDDAALEQAVSSTNAAPPRIVVTPEHLAYVLYTSGSTGRPKGVMVAHRSVVNLLASMAYEPGIDRDETTLSLTTLSFDVSVAELFLPLAHGAKVVVASREAARDPRMIAAIIERTGARTFGATPATWGMMVESGWRPSAGMEIHCAGEALPRPLADALTERGATLWNLYGPTETTVYASGIEVERDVPISIGRPLRNTQLYVVDDELRPLPIGVSGELCIAGAGVAHGYLGRAELTAEKFIPDPFSPRGGARMYRTGDLARWRADGTVDFLGRRDHQVKVRGFRIELGEIEAALRAVHGVADAVVVARDDGGGEKRLVGYVVTRVDLDVLTRALGRTLPDYMIPQAFVVLDALPVNPSGKVDRKALPAPDFVSKAEYVAPRTPLEQTIARAFAEVLKVPRVGADDEFFALGGHSLLATRLAARLRSVLGVEVPVRAIFERSTVAKLADRLGSARAARKLPPIQRVARDAPLIASYAQERLWFLEQLDPGRATYNVPLVLRLRGALDEAALARSLAWLVARHESLRTTFAEVDGRLSQVVHESMRIPLERDIDAREIISRRFDLLTGPLMRAGLSRVGPDTHVLALVLHHIVTDGASMELLERELGLAYTAFSRGEVPSVDGPPMQYADYAAWQREWLASGVLEEQLRFWTTTLRGAPSALEITTDFPRPATKRHAGSHVQTAITPDVAARAASIAREEGATPFMVLLAAFYVFLARHSGQSDLVVGTPIAGRTRPELDALIGFFVNTLALRVSLDGEPTFRDVVRRVKKAALDAFEHQDVPFEKIVEAINPARDTSRTPLFQAMFSHRGGSSEGRRLGSLSIDALPATLDTAKFDLVMSTLEDERGIEVELEYDTALFEHATAKRMAERYVALVTAAVEAPDSRALRLRLMSKDERRSVLRHWAGTATAPPARLVHELFAERATRTPDAVAIAGTEVLSYGNLRQRVTALAAALRARGVGPDVIVGVCVERSSLAVIAILAVLEAGGAYLPIEPTLPDSRVRWLVEDANASLLVSTRSLTQRANATGATVLWLDDPIADAAVAWPRPAQVARPVDRDSLAYVIYTSGSTGQPKGVMVSHGGLAVYVAEAVRRYGAGHRAPLHSSLAFDLTVTSLFLPLVTGGYVTPVPGADVEALARALSLDPRLSLVKITPAHLELLEAHLSNVDRARARTYVIGGEALLGEMLESWRRHSPQSRFINEYGPTETVVGCGIYEVATATRRSGAVPIGKPLDGTRLYVLDRDLEPTPIGIPGELYIGGAQITRGYLQRPALTADRFVPDPFAESPGSRLYRTGDLVRWLDDGNLEYLDRIDRQVKVRGYRIELGEIESALRALPRVREAVVLARGDSLATRRLVAYVAPASGMTLDAGGLARALNETLPPYMIPSAFVVLPSLPLTANGKVDRAALPAPDFESVAEYVAPRTPAEETIAATFADVLGVARVGVHDDFFALGGHSMIATRVASRLRVALNVDVPVRAIFERPTVARLAERLVAGAPRREESAIPRVTRSGPLDASYAQERLWFLEQLDPGHATYNVPLLLRLRGELDDAALERSIAWLVARHEILRTTFTEIEGRPLQVVHPSMTVPLERNVTPAEFTARSFDLVKGPLVRVGVSRTGPDELVLAVVLHHIVTDGASMAVLERDLGIGYSAFSRGGSPPAVDALPLQYADYAAWQRAWLASGVLEEQLRYWKEALRDASLALELPTDRPRPALKQHRGSHVTGGVAGAVIGKVATLAREEGATPFMVLLAAFYVFLARHSGQNDLVVGTPIAGRTRPELDGLVGFFVNTLALRAKVDGEPTFREVLRRVKTTALDAFDHQDVPFEKIVEAINPPRDTSRTPVFQATFVYDASDRGATLLEGTEATILPSTLDVSKFDLTLVVTERRGELEATFEYDSALFEHATAQLFVERYGVLLEAAVATPDQLASALPMMTVAEERRVLSEWNATSREYARDAYVHALVESTAARTPEAVAVVSGSETLTYEALERRATAFAATLIEQGAGPGDIVAIHLPRSVDFVVAALAILKAGAAYLPIDWTAPHPRVSYMLEDSGARIFVTRRDGPLSTHARAVLVEEVPATAARAMPSLRRSTNASLAYVIYTSGSTGRPKGSGISHRNLVAMATSNRALLGIEPGMSCAQFSNVAFDAHVYELWPALIAGAAVHLVPEELRTEPERFAEWLVASGIHCTFAPTALADALLTRRWPACALRWVTVAGDALGAVPSELPPFGVLNAYGPTECTVCATAGVVTAGDARPDIGGPIGNVRVYVLDRSLAPVPVGVPGELYIAGELVGRGYLGRPHLTAASFVPDPFSATPGERMYRTGDVVSWLPSGKLEFRGRIDHQVKIRGFRVELGEIESALAAQPGIDQALVVARDDAHGGKRLAAYVVQTANSEVDVAAVRSALGRTLPDYMIPNAFVLMASLPLTANGKVDRKALPAPDFAADTAVYVAPRTPTERVITECIAEVLRAERVGVDDDFFALGAHSLLATKIASRLRSALDVDVPVRAIFEHPTAARLAEQLDRAQPSREAATIPCVPRGSPLAASYAQERLWFLDRLDPGQATYNVPLLLRLRGELDESALERSIALLVARHESLRTTFTEIEGRPSQVIHASMRVPLERGIDPQEVAARPFDLANGPLIRAGIARIAPDEHVLAIVLHHIVTDGASMEVLARELDLVYSALSLGRVPPDPPQAIQYADYAAWQRRWLTSGVLEKQLSYWRETLQGAPAALEMPTDRPRPASKRHRGAGVRTAVEADVAARVARLARDEGGTPFMVLLAAFHVFLARHSRQTDLVVGTAIAGRTRPELDGLVGFFVNTLALRAKLDGATSFREVLRRVRTAALGAYEHQDVPFEKLVEAINPPRDTSRTPIFQAMFLHRAAAPQGARVGTLEMRSEPVALATAKFDLLLGATESEGGIDFELEYDVALFDHRTAERLVERYVVLLEAAIMRPDEGWLTLPIITDAERRRVLVEWNAPQRRPSHDATIDALVAAQAERTPDAVAVTDGEGRTLSYRELSTRAKSVAGWLMDQGVRRGDRVAVSVRRTVDMVTSVLGVLMARGAYVPVDAKYPDDRRAFMMRDAGCVTALTDVTLEHAIARPAPDDSALPRVAPDDLAYVIFTSGSTGRPKGVMVEHRSVVNLIDSMLTDPGYGPNDVALVLTTLSFDVAGAEIWVPLAAGSKLVVAPEEAQRDPAALAALLERTGATVAGATPATWQMLTADGWRPSASMRIHTAGEALARDLADRLLERGARLFNLFGPTETTIYSTGTEVVGDEHVTIGRPVESTQTYVLDARLEPVPIGVPGELYIGGAGVARGYLERPALTAERFIPDPFAGGRGARMYRTGDLVRWLPEGRLDYLGRIDHQVKVRGFRIELGEIEATIAAHAGVESTIVIAREDTPGDKRIVAYVVARPNNAPTTESLRAAVAAKLPEYMVPNAFVTMEALPLNANGKVDRKALPAPDFTSAAAEYVAPRTATERVIAELFAEVLGAKRVGVSDDFFALGGHSLLVAKLVAAVHNRLDVAVPLATFFKRPTVEHLAAAVDSGGGVRGTLLNLREGDERAAVVLVAPVGGKLAGYFELIAALGDVHVVGLRAVGLAPEESPLESIEAIAAAHVEVLRASHPGPYVLAGWSFGGVLAFEIARRLAADGAAVAEVVAIDAYLGGEGELAASEIDLLLGFFADLTAPRDAPTWTATSSADPQTIWDAAVEQGLIRPDKIPNTRRAFEVYRKNLAALARYRPARSPVDVHWLRATHTEQENPGRILAARRAWSEASRKVVEAVADADHYSIVRSPAVTETARAILTARAGLIR